MLTIPFIRTNTDLTIAGLTKKHVKDATEVVAQLLVMDDKRKSLLQQAEQALEKSNAAAKEIGALMQSGQKELAEGKRAETAALKGEIKVMEDAARAAEAAGAAQRCNDMEEAVSLAVQTVQNKELQQIRSHHATQFAQQHGGGTHRTALAVLELLHSIKDLTVR